MRELWIQHLGSQPPLLRSAKLLGGILAWRVQAEALGGFDSWTAQRLRQLAVALEKDPDYQLSGSLGVSPGVVLTREWKGVLHRVLVERDGFMHERIKYRTLTEVARAITGTHWSGPRFFGLAKSADNRAKGKKS